MNVALNEGILKPHENVGAFRAQTVDSHCGKILRLNPINGDGLPSNPFFDASEPRAPRSRVWALGLRNPFRMALKPESGSHDPEDGDPGALYIGDVGYVTWEELNVCDGPGQNFGWPIYEGHYLEPGYAPVLTENPSAPNPLGSNCGIDYFRYQDLLVQDTANTPYWGNPCDSGGVSGDELLENGNFNSDDFFLGKRNSVPSSTPLPSLPTTLPSCTGRSLPGRPKPGLRKTSRSLEEELRGQCQGRDPFLGLDFRDFKHDQVGASILHGRRNPGKEC